MKLNCDDFEPAVPKRVTLNLTYNHSTQLLGRWACTQDPRHSDARRLAVNTFYRVQHQLLSYFPLFL